MASGRRGHCDPQANEFMICFGGIRDHSTSIHDLDLATRDRPRIEGQRPRGEGQRRQTSVVLSEMMNEHTNKEPKRQWSRHPVGSA